MKYSIENKEDVEALEELAMLKEQEKELGLQQKLGKQGFHYDSKGCFEPITKAIKNTN